MLFKTYIYYFYFNKEEIIKYIIEKKYKEVINLKLDKDFYKLLFNKNFYVFQYICCYYPNEIYYYLNKLIDRWLILIMIINSDLRLLKFLN